MITAYDYPTAKHAEYADFDILLVGDSLGMVVLGYDTTQPVTMEEMLHHCKAARRGAPSRFMVGDLPFGSYEVSPEKALENAMRLVKEGGMDAVKLEGGANRAATVRKIVDSGVSVMGHVGLTPQCVSVLGGFRAQGRTAAKAGRIVEDAMALQEAGAFAVVIECVPAVVAQAVTDSLQIPTIGIGAGPGTDGQVLVYHDLLGMMNHPHHEQHVPSFCKTYLSVGGGIHEALCQFRGEVKAGQFPTPEHCPYVMSDKEQTAFEEDMQAGAARRQEGSRRAAEGWRLQDEYAATKIY